MISSQKAQNLREEGKFAYAVCRVPVDCLQALTPSSANFTSDGCKKVVALEVNQSKLTLNDGLAQVWMQIGQRNVQAYN